MFRFWTSIFAVCLTAGSACAQSDIEIAYVKKLFSDLQARSFSENREICGFIGVDRWGNLATTDIRIGTEATCALPEMSPKLLITASFHTHSTYSPDFRSEFPTVQDIDSDRNAGIDGWIATPGGRLWFHDHRALTVTEVCGLSCLPPDPNFRVEDGDPVLKSYSRAMLMKIERQ